jgi:outer membrane protein TolC
LIGVATADLYPAFSISGNISWQASEFSNLFSSAANSGAVGPAFNWKILNYGRIVNNIEAQEARFQQFAVGYQQTVLNANAEVEVAIIEFLKSQERVQSLREAVNAILRSQEIVVRQYQEGVADLNRVYLVQEVLVDQQDSLARAEADIALSLIRVHTALGGGWGIRMSQRPAPLPPTDLDLFPAPPPTPEPMVPFEMEIE